MSPQVLDRFYESPRTTSLPYAEWLTGQRLLLVGGEDFTEDPRKVVSKIYAYARRKDWAVVAVLTRKPTDPPQGPKRHIQVWGDTSRTYDQGAPDEIRRELGRRTSRTRTISR